MREILAARARRGAGAARAAGALVGGRVRRLGRGVPAHAGLHARPRRASVEARGRASLPDAAGAGDRRPRRPRGRPVPVRPRGQRRAEGHLRGPGRARDEVVAAPPETTLRTLAREGGAGADLLEAALADVSERLDPEAKDALLERMAEPGFWEDEGRVAVLSEIELRDRMEAGLRSAQSLLNRIRSARHPPAALVRRAAQRLILLDAALTALGRRRGRRRAAAGRRRPAVRPADRRDVPGVGDRARDAPATTRPSAAAASSAGARPSRASPRCRRCGRRAASTCSRSPTAAAATSAGGSRVTVRRRRLAARPSSAATASARRRWCATPSAAGAPGASTRCWRRLRPHRVAAAGRTAPAAARKANRGGFVRSPWRAAARFAHPGPGLVMRH